MASNQIDEKALKPSTLTMVTMENKLLGKGFKAIVKTIGMVNGCEMG